MSKIFQKTGLFKKTKTQKSAANSFENIIAKLKIGPLHSLQAADHEKMRERSAELVHTEKEKEGPNAAKAKSEKIDRKVETCEISSDVMTSLVADVKQVQIQAQKIKNKIK